MLDDGDEEETDDDEDGGTDCGGGPTIRGEGGDGVIRLEDGLVFIVIGDDDTEFIKPIPPS